MTSTSDYLNRLHAREAAAQEATARQTVNLLEHITGVDVPSGTVRVLHDQGAQVFGFKLYKKEYTENLYTYAVPHWSMPVTRHRARYSSKEFIQGRADWIRLLEEYIPYDIALQQSKLAAEMAGEVW